MNIQVSIEKKDIIQYLNNVDAKTLVEILIATRIDPKKIKQAMKQYKY